MDQIQLTLLGAVVCRNGGGGPDTLLLCNDLSCPYELQQLESSEEERQTQRHKGATWDWGRGTTCTTGHVFRECNLTLPENQASLHVISQGREEKPTPPTFFNAEVQNFDRQGGTNFYHHVAMIVLEKVPCFCCVVVVVLCKAVEVELHDPAVCSVSRNSLLWPWKLLSGGEKTQRQSQTPKERLNTHVSYGVTLQPAGVNPFQYVGLLPTYVCVSKSDQTQHSHNGTVLSLGSVHIGGVSATSLKALRCPSLDLGGTTWWKYAGHSNLWLP